MKISRLVLALSLAGFACQAGAALHIISVQWGKAGGPYCDGTAVLAAQCEGKAGCAVYAGNNLCPHPFQGWKEAIVTYSCDGRQYTDRFPETAQIGLPVHDPRGAGYIASCPGPATPGTSKPGNPPTTQPGQPPVVHQPPPQPPAANKPAGELVQNTGVRGGSGWVIVGGPGGWYSPSNGGGEVSFEGDGVRFRSTGGNTRYGVLQNINKDVSGCGSLALSASVRNDQQTLTGTGWNAREAPIAVFVKYTDANGTVHEQLSENPNEPRNMFWNGFYYLDPTGNSKTQHGTRVGKGATTSFNVDLMSLSPRPKHIHFVGAEGGGWPPRDGKLHSLSLNCR